MTRRSLAVIWIGGAILAAALYVTGPERFISTCLMLADQFDEWIANVVSVIGRGLYDVIRAAAIAVLVVFLVLSFLAVRRGIPSFWSVALVGIAFIILVESPFGARTISGGRWVAALILALAGAVAMSRRLMDKPQPERTPFSHRWSG